jgi:hypothetical protein
MRNTQYKQLFIDGLFPFCDSFPLSRKKRKNICIIIFSWNVAVNDKSLLLLIKKLRTLERNYKNSESKRFTVNIINDRFVLLAMWSIQSIFLPFFLSFYYVYRPKVKEINFLCQAIHNTMSGTIFHPYSLQGVVYILFYCCLFVGCQF